MFKQFLKHSVSGDPLLAAEARIVEYLKPVAGEKPKVDFLGLAIGVKMTGDRAQVPSFACLRKTAARIQRGASTSGSWRSWPKEKANA